MIVIEPLERHHVIAIQHADSEIKFTFTGLDRRLFAEVYRHQHDIKKTKEILVSYLSRIDGVVFSNGKSVEPKDLYQLPITVVTELEVKFVELAMRLTGVVADSDEKKTEQEPQNS